MLRTFEPKLKVLPEPQQQIWRSLAPLSHLDFVLYGGTAVALHLGHRISIDFDFFRSRSLDKDEIAAALAPMGEADILQEARDTLVIRAAARSGSVKLSFFGGLGLGRINPPLRTTDSVLLVASPEDLLATKLKAILDRAEAKDYRDIAALLEAGISLPRGLAGFSKMFGRDAGLVLRAIGFFDDGDLAAVSESDRRVLRAARDSVVEIPDIPVVSGSLAAG
ncbi:MAG: nucleotidyl transferase AbiEii/AbiGii toxin family protein [Rhodopseudomonas palustris]|uniref:Nucleotidyl transferase AbiEii/AbiGii toxin family protein n=1 Tax=Rhodopseudomonas palustris TaxID=1076 RepID=A0A933RZ44_RHOPL|nr:nucleotidyl transferase AbiEii/AbiGii toxin family protein [Rhodopseudomonas palustris]